MRRHLPILAFAAIAAALGLVVSVAGAAYYLTQLTTALYVSLVVLGLCLLMGYAGQVSLGHAGFFAIGGYTAAAMTTWNLAPGPGGRSVELLRSLGLLFEREVYGERVLYLSPWLGLVAALLVTAAVALVIGIPVIRLKGHYLAMATLGFGIIVSSVARGTPLFGESDGIYEVPPFRLFAGLEVSNDLGGRVMNYAVACALVFAAMALSVNLIRSRVGRALRSIHENEEAANALGVDTARYKLATFVLSAVMAALAGVFLTHYKGSIQPDDAGPTQSVRYVAIVAVGGMANLWGALVMAIVLTFLSLRDVFRGHDDAVFGLILITIMLFAPRGILRVPGFVGRFARRRHAADAP